MELGNFDDFSRKASTHLHTLERIGFPKPILSLRDFQYKGGKVLFLLFRSLVDFTKKVKI